MKLLDTGGYGIVKEENLLSFTTGEKFYEFNFENVIEISKNKYLVNKYGHENKYWKEPFYEVAKFKNGEFLTVFYQEGIVRHHLVSGKIINEITSIHSPLGCGIYGMTLDTNENLWIAVPSEHYIGKFSISKGNELFSITGTPEMEPTIFNHPENIIAVEDKVYVCDMGNERIVEIDIESNRIIDDTKVKEPIYYFNKDINGFYYLFSSGLYFLKKNAS